MFTKRIIPCLDVKNGRVVKGVNFVDLKDAGDPVEIAKAYDKAGADEVVFLDITASSDQRGTVVDMVRKVAANVFIPFTVGGGIRTVDDFKMLLREGADKISINSSAINNPQLNIIPCLCSVTVHAGEQDFSGAKAFCFFCPRNGIDADINAAAVFIDIPAASVRSFLCIDRNDHALAAEFL